MSELLRHRVPWRLADLPPLQVGAPRVLSTFSCGGGSSMGYKLAGCEVVGAVDSDPKMIEVYRTNFPGTPTHCMPISEIIADGFTIPDSWRRLDILDGSPPCTLFSAGGIGTRGWGEKRAWREGGTEQVLDRLFYDFMDIVEILRPRVFIAENVEGMLRGKARGYVRQVVKLGRKHGYRVEVALLSAMHYGTPQNRRRVFFVGIRDDMTGCYEPPGVEVDPPTPVRPLLEVAPESYPLRGSLEEEIWSHAKPGDTGAEYYKKVRGRNAGFTAMKLALDSPSRTVSASSRIMHPLERRYASPLEIKRVGGFPDDYQISPDPAQATYIVGMSVPPQMAAAVAISALRVIA